MHRGECDLVRPGVIEHAHPIRVLHGADVADHGGHDLTAKALAHVARHPHIALGLLDAVLEGAHTLVDAQACRGVLVVGYADVHVGQELPHDGLGLLRGPHLASVVEVAHRGDAPLAAGHEGLAAGQRQLGRDGGRDAAHVEGPHAIKKRVPAEVLGRCHAHGGVLAVVDHGVGPLGAARLEDVHAHAVARTEHPRGVHPQGAEAAESAVGQAVLRQDGEVGSVVPLVGQRGSHVRLRAAEVDVEGGCLLDSQPHLWGQPHHELTKGKNLTTWQTVHGHSSLSGMLVSIYDSRSSFLYVKRSLAFFAT